MNNYIIECLERFQELPDDLVAAFEDEKLIPIIKELEDQYKITLSFVLVLLAIEELLPEDIAEYLNLKFKLEKEAAAKVQAEIISKIFDPIFEQLVMGDFIEKEISGAPVSPSIVDSKIDVKEFIIKLFTEGLVPTLNLSGAEINRLNILIFKAFNEHDGLEDKVISSLYNNKERLTRSNIIIDGKSVEPTIANWLKDFIKLNGSNLFNELVLADYITNSANAKSLPLDDKNKLRRLLRLYRNLVFFPESLENIPMDKWAIIPIDEQAAASRENFNKSKTTSASFEKGNAQSASTVFPSTIEVKTKLNKKPVAPETDKKSSILIKNTISPAPEAIKSQVEMALEELTTSRQQYSATSLEYKAITQEINKLKKAIPKSSN